MSPGDDEDQHIIIVTRTPTRSDVPGLLIVLVGTGWIYLLGMKGEWEGAVAVVCMMGLGIWAAVEGREWPEDPAK